MCFGVFFLVPFLAALSVYIFHIIALPQTTAYAIYPVLSLNQLGGGGKVILDIWLRLLKFNHKMKQGVGIGGIGGMAWPIAR